MKEIKKLLSIILASSMIISICACNNTSSTRTRKDDDDDDHDQRIERTEEDTKSTTDETAKETSEETSEETEADDKFYYYLVDDKSPEQIVELYAYYQDLVDELGYEKYADLKEYLPVEPEKYELDDGGLDIYYAQVENGSFDYVYHMSVSAFDVDHIEFSMSIRVYDVDKVMAISEAFKNYYAVEGTEVKKYTEDDLNLNDGGYKITKNKGQKYYIEYGLYGAEGAKYYIISMGEINRYY